MQREVLWLGLAMAMAILTAVAGLAYWNLDAAQDTMGWVEHTGRVLAQIEVLSGAYTSASSARSAALATGDARDLQPIANLDARMGGSIGALRTLVADNPPQLARLSALEELIHQRFATMDALVDRRVRGEPVADPEAELALGARVRTLLEDISHEEDALLAQRDARTHADVTRTKVAIVAGTIASFAILLVAFELLRRENARRRKAAIALAEARDAAEAANENLESFSYSVAHDLRAPLRAIDGFSQALEEDCAAALGAEGLDYLRRVRASVKRMGQLIDSLLALSRVSRAELTREPLDLTALAEQTVAHLRDASQARRVEVTVERGLAAQADARLVGAVLENLIGNAWKFTSKRDDARIEVGSRVEDGRRVFFVRDNGAGFDPAYSNKLFGAFQRLHRTTEFEGNGIGLATVQRIVHRHGGRVWAEGAVGRGATFYFTL